MGGTATFSYKTNTTQSTYAADSTRASLSSHDKQNTHTRIQTEQTHTCKGAGGGAAARRQLANILRDQVVKQADRASQQAA